MPERYGPGRSVSVSLQIPDFLLVKDECSRLGTSPSTLIGGWIEGNLQALREAANAPAETEESEENPGIPA